MAAMEAATDPRRTTGCARRHRGRPRFVAGRRGRGASDGKRLDQAWVSNTRARRDKLTPEQMDALR
jgi:hypothetical protein